MTLVSRLNQQRPDRPDGALVVHGLTGSPSSVEGVASALAARGLEVRAPLLPGHGTTIEDLDDARWPDWVGAVEEEHRALAARCGRVVLFGLSMGGTLCCWLAATNPDIAGLVVLNPFIDPPAASFHELLGKIADRGITRLPSIGGDVADESVREEAFGELPLAPFASLCEGLDELFPRLPDITCPLLVLTSRTDHVVPPVSSDVLADRVSGSVSRVWLERSYHVATLDHDRGEVERLTVDFVTKVLA